MSKIRIKDANGGPMPTALGDLTDVEIVRDADGKFLYNVFVLKGGVGKQ